MDSVSSFTPQGGMRHGVRLARTDLQSYDSENEAMFTMMKARDCVYADSCSVDTAEAYLQEVLHLQSDCVAGSIVSHDICEDILLPNEIIVGLRGKIEKSTKNPQSNELSIHTSNIGAASLSIIAIYVVFNIFAINQPQGVDPFTFQEFWWAARDGYLSDLLSQFVKNGGLVVV